MIVKIGDEIDGCAVDTSAGGRLSSLVLAGHERLLGEPASGIEPSIGWGCYVMAPFVGRVFEGTICWHGRTAKLPLNNGRHAIHGAVFDVPWEVAAQTPGSVTLACTFDPARWPFRGSMTQSVTIERGHMTLEAEILAEEPMPAAIGWHPWLRTDGADLHVGVQSDSVLRLASDLIPTGELQAVDERTDLRARPSLAGRRLDDVFVSVDSPAVVDWPDLELVLAFERPVAAVVVFSHPQAVCIEPATAWPDSIRLVAAGRNDTGLVSLEAGGRLRASTSWSWTIKPAAASESQRSPGS
jgi:galactose mutarotase-like enzyme